MAGRDGDSSQYLSLVGVNLPHVGYGRMVAGLRGALANRVTLCDDAERVVFALRPNLIKGWNEGQKPALLTMWETNWLPPQFSEYLKYFDVVVVPSLHNWELFSQFHDNVRVVNLAVDHSIYFPKEREPNEKFKILCGGSEWHRKGLDVVLDVFRKLGHPDWELHIKIVPPYLSAPEDLDFPNVVVHRNWMTPEAEADLMRSCDVFVSVSRGEGFGLMPLQSIACGVPTIVSDAHGHREFSDLANFRVPTVSVPTNNGVWKEMGDWDEPDRDDLALALFRCFGNLAEEREIALRNSQETRVFNWDSSASELLKAVRPTGNRVAGGFVPLEPTCTIMVSKRIQAQIGRHQVDLEPGVKHRVVLNVRDVLRSSGVVTYEEN